MSNMLFGMEQVRKPYVEGRTLVDANIFNILHRDDYKKAKQAFYDRLPYIENDHVLEFRSFEERCTRNVYDAAHA